MLFFHALFILCYNIEGKQNLAEYYLSHLNLVDTPEKRNKAIIKCLAEISLIIDKEATKKTVKTVIEEKFNPITSLIDSKDRDMKMKFNNLQNEAFNLEKEINQILNETEESLHRSLKNIRPEMIESYKEIVKYSQTVNDNNINQIVSNVDESIERQKAHSSKQAIIFFVLLQVILAIALLLSYKYVRNLKI